MSDQTGNAVADSSAQEIANASTTKKAIHDAFLIGWSIQELKSRVLFGAYHSQPLDYISEKAVSGNRSAIGLKEIEAALANILQAVIPFTSQSQGLLIEQGKSIVCTSEWRAIFIRIASVHDYFFPGSTTDNTAYNMDNPRESFPYL